MEAKIGQGSKGRGLDLTVNKEELLHEGDPERFVSTIGPAVEAAAIRVIANLQVTNDGETTLAQHTGTQ